MYIYKYISLACVYRARCQKVKHLNSSHTAFHTHIHLIWWFGWCWKWSHSYSNTLAERLSQHNYCLNRSWKGWCIYVSYLLHTVLYRSNGLDKIAFKAANHGDDSVCPIMLKWRQLTLAHKDSILSNGQRRKLSAYVNAFAVR